MAERNWDDVDGDSNSFANTPRPDYSRVHSESVLLQSHDHTDPTSEAPSKNPPYVSGDRRVPSKSRNAAGQASRQFYRAIGSGVDNDENVLNEPSRYRVSLFQFVMWWAFEIFCLVVGMISFFSIVWLLKKYDGRPTTDWTFPLTINTTVSVLGTVVRSLAVSAVAASIGQGKWIWFRKRRGSLRLLEAIDNASRGFGGSAMLLVHTKGLHLVSAGAFALLLSPVVGPTLQALIRATGQNDPVLPESSATIGSSQYLDGGTSTVSWYSTQAKNSSGAYDGNLYAWDFTRPDLALFSAYYAGFAAAENISQAGKQLDPTYTCSSGNCTWNNFLSMAVCSECFDVSKSEVKSVSLAGSGARSDIESEVGFLDGMKHYYNNLTNYTLPPYDIRLNNYDGYRVVPSARFPHDGAWDRHEAQGIAQLMGSAMLMDPRQTINFQHLETMLMSYALLRPNDSYVENKTSWEDTAITATECALYFCINEYQSNVTLGSLTETVVASSDKKVPESWMPYSMDDQPYNVAITNFTAIGTLDWNPIYQNGYIYRYDFQLDPRPIENSNISSVSSWNLTQSLLQSTMNFMGSDGNNIWLNLDWMDSLNVSVEKRLSYNSPTLRAIYPSTNLSKTFETVAESMTNAMRDTGILQKGETMQWTMHFRIHWLYAIPTASFLAIGTLFTFLSIWQTHRARTAAWKTNSLATMAYGLDEVTRQHVRTALEAQNMKDASRVAVVMQEGEGGVSLSMSPSWNAGSGDGGRRFPSRR